MKPGDVKTDLIMNNDDDEAAKKVYFTHCFCESQIGFELQRCECLFLKHFF